MISLEKNFLFIHPPKTGGTSVKDILKRYETRGLPGAYHSEFFNELVDENWQSLSEVYNEKIQSGDKEVIDKLVKHSKSITDPDRYVTYNKTLSSYLSSDYHFSYSQYKCMIREDVFENLIKFGITRNPFDRILSIHLWQDGVFDREVFIKKIKKYAYILFNDWNPCYYYLAGMESDDSVLKPCDFIDKNGINVDTFIKFNEISKFHIRFESHLNQDTMNSLCKTLGIEPDNLRHLNKSKEERKH